ncbi:hypothetical protein AK812_SmicGene644 [Symbiodinium microadriaticum]|uniref:Uncharacterized protein n=1 Tax=Symbiodinium microadriaticum TaxID=2951 RepID=A0A1Q9F677_SYMMI|nr:hypothetical protein AK812_SmicGene644 [Symbiodinium microadriaticum]
MDPFKAQTREAQGGWEDFIKDCGFKTYLGNPIHVSVAFNEKFKNKTVHWQGAVRHMEEGFNLLGYAQPSAVFVDMEPAQFSRKRDASDLVLFFKEDKEISATMRHLKRGDKIDFTATMVEVGKRGAPHAMALWDVSLPSRPGDSPKANATQWGASAPTIFYCEVRTIPLRSQTVGAAGSKGNASIQSRHPDGLMRSASAVLTDAVAKFDEFTP